MIGIYDSRIGIESEQLIASLVLVVYGFPNTLQELFYGSKF